jgi:predicted permease
VGSPPRLAESLLRRLLPQGPEGRAILGDLHEDFIRKERKDGQGAARAWYWREAAGLCAARLVGGWRPGRGDGRRDARNEEVMMRELGKDLALALRSGLRAPGATAMVVVVLGVGIGSSTAVFSAHQAVLFPDYPFAEPDQLVLIGEAGDGDLGRMTVPDVEALRREGGALAHVAAYRPGNFNLTGLPIPERLEGMYVTGDWLELLGVRPILGAGLGESAGAPGGTDRAVVSHGLWTRLSGADPRMLGTTLTLDGASFTVVGILPEAFWFPNPVDVVIPSDLDPAFTDPSATRRIYRAMGRLRDGVTPSTAETGLQGVLDQARPPGEATEVAIVQLRQALTGDAGRVLILLQAAAVLLLVLGLANAAGIILARSVGRRPEVLLRVALGAGPGRLARGALAEGAVLGMLGGAVGLGFAWALLAGLPNAGNLGLGGPGELDIGAGALGFCLAAAVVTGALVSVVPAVLATRAARRVQRVEARWATSSGRDRQLQHVLLVGQVALTLVLAVSAGSVTRSLMDVLSHDPGFRPDGVISMRVSLSGDRYGSSEAVAAFYHRLSDEVGGLAGVQRTGVTLALPFSGTDIGLPVEVADEGGAPTSVEASFRTVAADYFETLEIPLLEGRYAFSEPSPGNAREAVVSEALARKLGRSAVGLTARLDPDSPDGFEIVGVVGDVRHADLTEPPEPVIYLGYEAYPMTWGYLVARTDQDPMELVPGIRRTVAALDSEQPVYSVAPLDGRVADSTRQQRWVALLVGVFALSALLILASGIYGVVSAHVARLTRELGVRAALGAPAPALVGRVARGVGLAVAAGSVLGCLGAAWAMELAAAFLYEVARPDATSMLLAVAAIAVTALLAALGPARRAIRIDPVRALAAE